MTSSPLSPRPFLRLILLALVPATSHAVDRTWTGGSGNINNPSRWGGTAPGSSDTAFFTDGTAFATNLTSGYTVGELRMIGSGRIEQTGGTFTSAGEMWVGQGNVSDTTYRIEAGTLRASDWLVVGRNAGIGTLEITGGTVEKSGTGNFIVGARDGGASQGTVNQTGGSVSVASELWIGQNTNAASGRSTGTYNLQGGVIDVQDWLAVGREGGNGNLNITGGTLVKSGANNIEIGGTSGSTGIVTISSGSLDAAGYNARIGMSSAGSGTLTLSGTGRATLGAVRFSYSNNGNGTVNMNGGTLEATRIEKVTAGTGTVNFNGGLLKALTSDTTYMQGLTSANILAGGARINTNGFNITVAQPLLAGAGNGGLAKEGAGTLTLAGSNTYTGTTTVDQGTLALASTGSFNSSTRLEVASGAILDVSAVSGFSLLSHQTLSGFGTVTGSLNVAGTLSPGSGPGGIATGAQTWLNGGDYNFQMLDAAGNAGAGWDLLSVAGVLNLSNLTPGGFNINLWTLFNGGPEVNGNAANFDSSQNHSWTIANATGGITGFDEGDFLIRTAANNGTGGWANSTNGGIFGLARDGNKLVLTFTAVPEPATAALTLLSGLACLRRRRL